MSKRRLRREIGPYDYPRGHRETPQEYLNRGGQVTRIVSAWSRHLTATPDLLTRLNGDDDVDLPRWDVPVEVRAVRGQRLMGDIAPRWMEE